MKKILIFGTSYMGEEYLKVLSALGRACLVVGRDESKAKKLADSYSYESFGGGVSALDSIDSSSVSLVIIATAVESLKELTIACLKKGFSNILIEKPGALTSHELKEMLNFQSDDQKVHIAYNRRYHASTLKMKEIMKGEDVKACFFDFTDREKDIVGADKNPAVLQRWGFANSSHVIDMAFSLIGLPKDIDCRVAGSMEQHPSGTSFVGSGETDTCLFSYFSTWTGGGRWDVEVSTENGRYKLSPLERISFCKKNQFAWEELNVDYTDDTSFKPGLKKMVLSVLEEGKTLLPTLAQQAEFSKIIDKIFSYGEKL